MHNIIIIDSNKDFFEKISRKFINSNKTSLKNLIIEFDFKKEVKGDYYENNNFKNLSLLIDYTEQTKEKVDDFLSEYEFNNFRDKINIVIYTNIHIKNLPDVIFTDLIQYLIFYKDKDFKVVNKLEQYIIAKKNWKSFMKNKNILTKEKYLEEAISRICDNKKLIGYNYLYESCILCIDNPAIMTNKFKEIFESLETICNADTETIDRSIRNFIKKGVTKDNLSSFIQYTKIDISSYKPTNSHIIFAVVLGYQNMIVNIDDD